MHMYHFLLRDVPFFAMHEIWFGNTVDGRNPAPPGMVKALKIMG